MIEEFKNQKLDKCDATISVEHSDAITLHARGPKLNTEYAEGLTRVIKKIWSRKHEITRIELASRTAKDLPKKERLIKVDYAKLSELMLEEAVDSARRLIMTAVAKHNRAPGAKGSGNATKRISIFFAPRNEAEPIENLDWLDICIPF